MLLNWHVKWICVLVADSAVIIILTGIHLNIDLSLKIHGALSVLVIMPVNAARQDRSFLLQWVKIWTESTKLLPHLSRISFTKAQ